MKPLSLEWQVLLKCLDKKPLVNYEEMSIASAFGYYYWMWQDVTHVPKSL